MYYIYELSFNGRPFYVGFSANPYNRFNQHCRDIGIQYTYDIIKPMLKMGFIPDMTIVAHFECKKQAKLFEKNRILLHVNNNIYLCNRDGNPKYVYNPAEEYKRFRFETKSCDHIKQYFENYNKQHGITADRF